MSTIITGNVVSLSDIFSPVNPLLERVEEIMLAQTRNQHPDLAAALGQILSSGGKRVRPAIALLSGLMFNADEEKLTTLSAALELLHTATLVHDDLIDGSLLRRGIATLNSQWSSAATVLTGDFIFARAAVLAAQANSVEVMRIFSETLATIVNGEISQLFDRNGLADQANYLKRIYAKTASLFESATSAAVVLSSAPANDVTKMRSFGYYIGMAFQIVDDVLDFSGLEETVGKPVGSDLRQGLITLPTIYYLEACPDDPDIELILRNGDESKAAVDRIIQAVREKGGLDKSMRDARQYIEQGIAFLAEYPDNQYKQALVDLANYIISRQL